MGSDESRSFSKSIRGSVGRGEEQPASESPNEDSKSTVQTDIAHEDPDPDIEPTDEDQTLEQTENEEGTSGTIFQKKENLHQ